MQRMQGAILAAITGLVGVAGLGPLQEPLPEPLQVRFKLADGVQVAGMMTAWDPQGFDGSFGHREWVDLIANDVWKLYRRVMDDQHAEHWVDLGGVLLLLDGGGSRAEQAFVRALRLDQTVAEAIDAARHEADEVRRHFDIGRAKLSGCLAQDAKDIPFHASLRSTAPEHDLLPSRFNNQERIGAEIGVAADFFTALHALEQEGMRSTFGQLEIGRDGGLEVRGKDLGDRDDIGVRALGVAYVVTVLPRLEAYFASGHCLTLTVRDGLSRIGTMIARRPEYRSMARFVCDLLNKDTTVELGRQS